MPLTRNALSLFLLVGCSAQAQEVLDLVPPADVECRVGSEITFVDDLTGDGVRDVIAAAETTYPHGTPGCVTLYDGRTGDPFRTHLPVPGDGYRYAREVFPVGDLTGDGRVEYAASLSSSFARVFDGATGDTLAPRPYPGFPAGDPDADGVPDYFAFGTDGAGGCPDLEVHAGASGARLYTLDYPNLAGCHHTPFFDQNYRLVGDLDGDGIEDFAVPAESFVVGKVHGSALLFSGADGALLFRLGPELVGPAGETSCCEILGRVRGVSDVSGDGQPDLFAASALLFSGEPAPLVVASGVDGTVLRTILRSDGEDVLDFVPVPDLNADGVPDAVMVSGDFLAHRLSVVSGVDGRVLRAVPFPSEADYLVRRFDAYIDAGGALHVAVALHEREGEGDRASTYLYRSASSTARDEGPARGSAALLAPFPNPAGTSAVIPFRLSTAGPIRLVVMDLLGREVGVLAEGSYPPGTHRVPLATHALSAGLFALRLDTADGQYVQRLVVVR